MVGIGQAVAPPTAANQVKTQLADPRRVVEENTLLKKGPQKRAAALLAVM
jgi:hemin uptake protein HemP